MERLEVGQLPAQLQRGIRVFRRGPLHCDRIQSLASCVSFLSYVVVVVVDVIVVNFFFSRTTWHTKHSCLRGIQVCSNKVTCLFPRGHITRSQKVKKKKIEDIWKSSSWDHWIHFNLIVYKSSVGKRNQVNFLALIKNHALHGDIHAIAIWWNYFDEFWWTYSSEQRGQFQPIMA